MYKIIVVPGLGDRKKLVEFIMKYWWRKFSSDVHIFGWRDKNANLINKQNKLLEKIDTLSKNGSKVYLIGISAGGSAVLNAFMARRSIVNGIVNVCGRLREGADVFPTLEQASRTSAIFTQSVKNSERNLNSLTENDFRKILTIRPIYDETVPISTVSIEGATNMIIPSFFHSISIVFSMIFLKRRITNFLISR